MARFTRPLLGDWGLSITWIYVRRRSLAPCIPMHVINGAYDFILLPILFRSFFPAG